MQTSQPIDATIVVPCYNSERTIGATLESLLLQTSDTYEIIVVDDGATDGSLQIVRQFDSQKIRIVSQKNRGLAGARNSGVAAAKGRYIGFCDADDLWEPEKLQTHIRHLDADPSVGISYAGSRLIDDHGRWIGLSQRPKLRNVSARDVLLRNPIGNGSSAVVRRAAFDDIAWRPSSEQERPWWFDERLRQSEDIECWIRFALTTDWKIEGVPGLLTRYRVNAGGLSVHIERQYATWEAMLRSAKSLSPEFVERHGATARAYQLRYLSRRAVSSRNGREALRLVGDALRTSRHPLWFEPVKTLTTLAAAASLSVLSGQREPSA